MKTTKIAVLALMLALAGITLSETALAGGYHHGGGYRGYYGPRVTVGLGFGFGYPYGYGYGYGYPYYAPYAYYPPYAAPVVQQPTTYVEQPQAQPQQSAQPSGYWYYCNDSRAYYPYVRDCASAWQRVSPQPE